MKKIFIGSDHRGFELKNHLKKYLEGRGYYVFDVGNRRLDPGDDYPEFAHKLAIEVQKTPDSSGILVCGSGVGVSIAANRHKGVRCAIAYSKNEIRVAREHNLINVLALSADTLDDKKAEDLVDTFLSTGESKEERHLRRVAKIELS